LKTYVTHEYAAQALEGQTQGASGSDELALFQERLQGCDAQLQTLVLQQYANLLLNKADLAEPALAEL